MICPYCKKQFEIATRSVPQNALYWKNFVEPIADASGATPEEIHEALKDELLARYITVKTKKGVDFKRIIGSTTTLKKKEFSDYLERVAQIAAQTYGIVIQTEVKIENTGRN